MTVARLRRSPLERAEEKINKLKERINKAEGSGIRYRWDSGQILITDTRLVTAAKHFRHGVPESLASALRVSERELRRRLQCARTYPTAADIGHICGQFRTWRDLCEAGFPPLPRAEPDSRLCLVPSEVDASPGETEPLDPGETRGRVVDPDGQPVQLTINLPGLEGKVDFWWVPTVSTLIKSPSGAGYPREESQARCPPPAATTASATPAVSS
jgi:hypothetical protein